MSPITHFLAGWVVFERGVASMRDKALVAVAGVAPDLDGLGIVIDFATRQLGLAPTDFYQQYHRMFAHGLPAAIVFSLVAAGVARQRVAVFALAFTAVHLHFLCDVVGSRGTAPEDIWPIFYFAPLSNTAVCSWSGQWPLVGWQNTLITALLLGAVILRAGISGYSPLGLVSPRVELAFVQVAQRWCSLVLWGSGGRGGTGV